MCFPQSPAGSALSWEVRADEVSIRVGTESPGRSHALPSSFPPPWKAKVELVIEAKCASSHIWEWLNSSVLIC